MAIILLNVEPPGCHDAKARGFCISWRFIQTIGLDESPTRADTIRCQPCDSPGFRAPFILTFPHILCGYVENILTKL
jgi:hypothetical protein